LRYATGDEATTSITGTNNVQATGGAMVLRGVRNAFIAGYSFANAGTAAVGNVSTFIGGFTDLTGRSLLSAIGPTILVGLAVRDDTDGITGYPTNLPDNRETITVTAHSMAVATGIVEIADQAANFAVGDFSGPSTEQWALARHAF
jgi:hypothetical protein